MRKRQPHVRRCCSIGTTAIAGYCRGGRRRADGRTPTPCGCRKSCCSRPGSKRSGLISRSFWRAGPMSPRSAAPRSTMSCECGLGLDTTRGPATCMPARSRCCATMTACFPIPKTACAPCPASGLTPPPPLPRLPSTAGPCRSTAISNAWCRGSSPSRRRCRRPSRYPKTGDDVARRLLAPATRSLAPAIARRR